MNILIPYSWISDFLVTDAKPEEVFRLTTATGPTIEGSKKEGNDYLLNIEVTINRPDCLSVLGIAREMYASLRQSGHRAELKNDYLSFPPRVQTVKQKIPLNFQIDSRLSPRFMAVVLKNIKIGPSPAFIQERLEKSGMRGLNNVIDITNFIMLELGQPNHAFDFEKIKGPTLIIRAAKKGEKVVTLDNKERELDEGDIVYEDGSGELIDLAGIMGGKESEIDHSTKTLLFTVVNDYFAQIRKTAMHLGLQTEASARLSKVLDQEMVAPTMKRAISLFCKYAGGEVGSQIFDFYPKKQKAAKIFLSDEYIFEKVGEQIPKTSVDSILKSLGFSVKRNKKNLTVVPPIWRINDVSIPEDLVEEVSRIYGYDHIPNRNLSFDLPEKDQKIVNFFLKEDHLRHLLLGWGFEETVSFSMLSNADLKLAKIDPETCIRIANPLTEEWEYMQPTLLPNLLKNLSKNQRVDKEIKIFEIGNVFDKEGREKRKIALGSAGNKFLAIKGVVEQLFAALNLTEPEFQNLSFEEVWLFDKFQSAKILIDGKAVGKIGLVIAYEQFGLKEPAITAEIDLSQLLELPVKPIIFKTPPPFPPIIEDLSFEFPERTPVGQITPIIKTASQLIKNVEITDSYKDTKTFKVTYQSETQNLSDKVIKPVREKVINLVEKKFAGVLKT